MRSTLGHVPIQSLSSFRVVPVSRALPLHASPAKQAAKPWVCQQCYRSYCKQNSLGGGAASIPAFNHDRISILGKSKIRKAWLSTTSKLSALEDGAPKPQTDLPSQKEGRRSQASKRFSNIMDHLQSNIFIAGQRLNDLTGYSGIEVLKKDIEEQGQPNHRAKLMEI